MSGLSGLSEAFRWDKARGDLTYSFGGQLLAKLVNYAVLAVLARHLSREGFGEFLYAAATASMFVLLTDPGTRRHLVREVATTPAQAADRFAEVLSIRMPLYVPYFAVLVGFALLLRPGILHVLLITGLYVGLRSLWGSFDAVFTGLRRVGIAVSAAAIGRVVLLCTVLFLVSRNAALQGILWGHVAAYGLLVLSGVVLVRRRVRGSVGARPGGRWATVLRMSLPFFLIDALEIVHFKVDTVMLGFFRPYGDVALYEGSAKLLEASQFVMRPLMVVYLPVCAALVVEERWSDVRQLTRRLLRWAGGLGTAIALAILLVAGLAVTFVYGRDFGAAAPLLRVLALATPLVYLSFVSLFVGNALHLERRAVGFLLASVVVNISANLLLIPPLGGMGAAVTTVATQGLLALFLLRLNAVELRMREAGQPPSSGTGRP